MAEFFTHQQLGDISLVLLVATILFFIAAVSERKKNKSLKASLKRRDRKTESPRDPGRPSHNLVLVNAKRLATRFERDMALMTFKKQIGEVEDIRDIFRHWR